MSHRSTRKSSAPRLHHRTTSGSWTLYRRLGTASPESLGIQILSGMHRDAMNSLESDAAEANRSKQELLGSILYELALASQGDGSGHTVTYIDQSKRHLERRKEFTPSELAHRQAQLAVMDLVRSRDDPSERQTRLNQRGCVRRLGAIMAQGTDVMQTHPEMSVRSHMRGMLSEIAFLGTFMATPGLQTVVAAPATDRQDRPKVGQISNFKQAIPGIQTSSAVDLNLFTFEGTSAAPSFTNRVQVKSNYGEQAEHGYDPDILTVFADQELFIESIREYRAFAQELQVFRGEPGPMVATGLANIELAQEVMAERL